MADSDDTKGPPSPAERPALEGEARRDFLKTVGVGGLGLGLGAALGAPAVAYVAFPLGHETVSGAVGFLRVGKSADFRSGQPVKVDVFADRRDAWNRVVQVKVGSAWVLRQGEKLSVYSTVCPHLGCAIDFDAEKFRCPCHKSMFTPEGKVESGPSPRAMDELEVEEKDGIVAIRYVRYRQGIAEKEVV